jgi:hypothetical protein
VQGYGIFDGPHDSASVAVIRSWHVNAVRVPLNEDCWLGINGVNPAYSGANYQNAIINWVSILHQNGLYVILDLHWNAPGGQLSTGQLVMADADHSPAFWQSVAATFINDHGVVFDLYNEPHGIDWNCWLNGCTSPGWQTAGMQSLVNAVRSTGSTNVVMAGGLQWSNDLTGWLSHRPVDPINHLAASLHLYNFNSCNNVTCWTNVFLPVAAQVPIINGELGESDCTHTFLDLWMPWADANGISYTGWTWNTWSCTGGPALITNYNGTPTAFGIGLRDHLIAINP